MTVGKLPMRYVMKGEHDVVLPVLAVLDADPRGRLDTGTLRRRVKAVIPLDAADMQPLRNRSDRRIDQIIRNLKSHKATPGNPFAEGLLNDVPRGFEITEAGRAFLTRGNKRYPR
jgi:hypothetical protein